MSTLPPAEFDTQLLNGLQSALSKARELGYPVETMDVSASVVQGRCSVHFSPLPTSDYITAGGDLTVQVSADSAEILDFRRGQ